MRRMQMKAINSKLNLLYAIRRVTSINKGKKTAGMDNLVYLTPAARYTLYEELRTENFLDWTPIGVRRIEIPRPAKSPRPLGIPTVKDRVVQMVVKNALEPEWEAVFENGSYGFRPGRSTHDAMLRIWRVLSSKKRQWVLDADIKGCFNNIAHDPLLAQLDGFPAQNLTRRWLKAGYFYRKVYHETPLGTPQGGIISPLLANIALHGMESALKVKYHKQGYIRSECPFIPIRYADDFVVMCDTEEAAQEAKEILAKWLAERGMEFAPEKTAIRQVTEGFDFLGWTFRLYRTKKGKKWLRAKQELTTLVKPSNKSTTSIKNLFKEIWRKNIGMPAWKAITIMNPILVGWANYHKFVNANETFRAVDHFQYLQAVRYARRKHPRKSWKWICDRYFKRTETKKARKTGKDTKAISNWTFSDGSKSLVQLRSISLENYVSVSYGRNVYNPADREYFLDRKLNRLIKKKTAREALYKRQQGICPICGENIAFGDWDEPLHVHHLIARKDGGKDVISNLMLLHEECHIQVHGEELSKSDVEALLREKISTTKIL